MIQANTREAFEQILKTVQSFLPDDRLLGGLDSSFPTIRVICLAKTRKKIRKAISGIPHREQGTS